ncbi:SGNH/GDSL hydrolase family protein [Microvirga mediterraneensis]|uniref:SGNH/GDSL hydrolase family protein n=1 Tax=Microvirga mediterraneensis TaxID=2754695 RepID=A0A838BK51_9HYPH|nr:SGNH/GDSL hydrolase family protein [Microvirga mediterraneensis]MBA1155479.1 SGNH/GDSL hydrolase family protein [Microvirga mediterraneensis]
MCSGVAARLKGQSAIPALAGKLSRHQPIRILAIGSSSTEGIGASSPDYTYPAQLEDDLAALWKEPVTVVNSGKGGETVIQTIERLEAALKADRYDLVIWQVGTNDAIKGVDEESFRALLDRGISAVRQAGTEMVLLDQQYFPSIKDLARYERFVNAVSVTGLERKVGVFSRYALMKEWNSRSPEELRSMLSADGFHMGDKGYDHLAGCMAGALQAMVEQSVAEAKPTVTAAASVRDR